MLKNTEKVIRQKLAPIGDEFSTLFIDALVLRVGYRITIAQEHGAEPEDAPQIIQTAIDEGCEMLRLALERMSDVNDAIKYQKTHGKGE